MHTGRLTVNESPAMILDELIALLGFRVEGEQNLRRFNEGLNNAGDRVTDLAKRAVAAAASIAGAFAGLAFVRGVTETGAQFERMEATLRIIEGSAEKARQSMDWVVGFAETTPYQLGEVTDAFVRMRAYGLDPMDGSLRAVGDAAAAMGKTIMDGVEAIADASTGENERLKEFGITAETAGDRITYYWQQNGERMSRTVSKNAGEITAALTDIFNARFAGAMLEQAKTFDGLMSNIGDRWTAFQRMVSDKGWFDFVKGQAGDFIDLFDRMRREGTVDRFAQSISDGMVAAGERVRGLGEALLPALEPTFFALERAARRAAQAFDFVGESFARVLSDLTGLEVNKDQGILALLGLIFLRAFPTAAAVTAVALGVEDIWTAMEGGESYTGRFIDALGRIRDAAKEAAEAGDFQRGRTQFAADLGTRLLGGNVEGAIKAFDDLKGAWEDLKASLSVNVFEPIGRFVDEYLIGPFNRAVAKIGELRDALRSLIGIDPVAIPSIGPGAAAATQGGAQARQPATMAEIMAQPGPSQWDRYNAALAQGFAPGGGAVNNTTNNNVTVGDVNVNVRTDASAGEIGTAVQRAIGERLLRPMGTTAPSPSE